MKRSEAVYGHDDEYATLSMSYTASLHFLFRFLPRDATRKRGLCCRPVSVRLSVALVYYIQTAEDIVKLLSRPGSPIILIY